MNNKHKTILTILVVLLVVLNLCNYLSYLFLYQINITLTKILIYNLLLLPLWLFSLIAMHISSLYQKSNIVFNFINSKVSNIRIKINNYTTDSRLHNYVIFLYFYNLFITTLSCFLFNNYNNYFLITLFNALLVFLASIVRQLFYRGTLCTLSSDLLSHNPSSTMGGCP